MAKMNAARHGLHSDMAVITTIGETARAWHKHRRAMFDAHRPQDAFESQMVDQLAELTWRLGRLRIYREAAQADDAELHVRNVAGTFDFSLQGEPNLTQARQISVFPVVARQKKADRIESSTLRNIRGIQTILANHRAAKRGATTVEDVFEVRQTEKHQNERGTPTTRTARRTIRRVNP